MTGNIRGKMTRAKIIKLLRIHAYSMALLANELMLSEATVLYHLRILEKENVVKLYKIGNRVYAMLREEIEDFRKPDPFLNVSTNVVLTRNEPLAKASEKGKER